MNIQYFLVGDLDMNFRHMAGAALAGFALWSAVASTASAATMTVAQTLTGSYSNIITNDYFLPIETDITGIFNYEQSGSQTKVLNDRTPPSVSADLFDPSLGTLLSAEVFFSLSNAQGDIDAQSANRIYHVRRTCTSVLGSCTEQTVTSDATLGIGVNLSQIEYPTSGAPGVSSEVEIGISSNVQLPDASSSIVPFFDRQPETASRKFTGLDAELFFTGTGQFDMQPVFFTENVMTVFCATTAATPGANSPNALGLESCRGTTRIEYGADYRIDVVYTYETEDEPGVVPLPASGLLLIGGLGALLLRRRR